MPKRRNILDLLQPSTELPKAYWDDLRALATEELKGGMVRPPYPKLHAFLREEHNITLDVTSVRNHYKKVLAECRAKSS